MATRSSDRLVALRPAPASGREESSASALWPSWPWRSWQRREPGPHRPREVELRPLRQRVSVAGGEVNVWRSGRPVRRWCCSAGWARPRPRSTSRRWSAPRSLRRGRRRGVRLRLRRPERPAAHPCRRHRRDSRRALEARYFEAVHPRGALHRPLLPPLLRAPVPARGLRGGRPGPDRAGGGGRVCRDGPAPRCGVGGPSGGRGRSRRRHARPRPRRTRGRRLHG